MTKDKALFAWFSRFGMNTYSATNVPHDSAFPYITYEYIAGGFDDGNIPIEVNMWFRTTSEAEPNQKAEAFRKYINDNDYIECDDGVIWVKTGTPWCQSLGDVNDSLLKRRYLNVTLEFLTE